MNEDDTERDNLYAHAERISAELGNMTLELKACIENVNSRSGSGQGDASAPLSKIVRILNNQLQALTNVDATTQDVTTRLEQLTGELSIVLLTWLQTAGLQSFSLSTCAAWD
jgi:hypothetical protein